MKNTFKPINLVFIGDWNIGQEILNSLINTSKECKGSSETTHFSLTQKINRDTELHLRFMVLVLVNLLKVKIINN